MLRSLGAIYSYVGGLTYLAGAAGWCALSLLDLRQPRRLREALGGAFGQLARMGAAALGVNTLCVALIAFAISYSSADLLRQYGANLYLANIVAIGLTEHLIPVLTGIIVAGHSGSRVAAELGTMQVTDEITAMKAMAMDPVRLLMLPRILGMSLAVPFLSITGDIVGLAVAGLVGYLFLDLTFTNYYVQLIRVLEWDPYLEIGLCKAFAFGAVVALVACYRGIRVRGGAEAVGDATTRSVVDSIILIILINTAVTILRFS